jgi:hypothetical protein
VGGLQEIQVDRQMSGRPFFGNMLPLRNQRVPQTFHHRVGAHCGALLRF